MKDQKLKIYTIFQNPLYNKQIISNWNKCEDLEEVAKSLSGKKAYHLLL